MSEMSPAEAVYFAAREKPPADRAAFLDAACAGDPDLRARVEKMLAAPPDLGGFLAPPDRTGHYAPPAAPAEAAGTVIAGKYKLLQKIGEGGMGAVWMADQLEPVKRRVAVKLIRAERDGSRTILSRFEAERQAIALMDHPHIAKLLDAGATDPGRPFFVMELVKGVPLTEYCDQHRLSVPARLALFVQICSAVQHAHQKGIIHRDLKPTNILVESHDGKPVPKVIDFGLAKALSGQPLTDHTLFTGFGTVAGTPLYMAPEQATFNALDVDTRADVYALGVILYELLTGGTPIERESLKKAAFEEVLRVIRESDPPTPSRRLGSTESKPSVAANRQTEPLKLGRFVRGELDWIVMKALSKERDRRYETANGFAKDVERFLAHEPVQAGPVGVGYRVRKFVRRNRGGVVAAGAVVLALVAGVAGTTVGLFRANAEAANARAAGAETAKQLGLTQAAEASARAEAANARAAEAKAVAREKAEKKARDTSEAVVEFMQEVFSPGGLPGQASPTRRVNPDLTVREALDYAAKGTRDQFKDQPDLEAAVRSSIGWAYFNLGAYAEARTQFERSLAGFEKAFGPENPETLTAVANLATAHTHMGDYPAAEPLFQRALAGREKALGPDHLATLKSVADLADLYRRETRYAAAEPLLQRSLAGAEKALGPDHPVTLTRFSNLGVLSQDKGDPAAAESLLQRALAGREKALGPDHPDTLTSANLLASLYRKKGDHAAAEPLYVRALAGREKALGPDHPNTLASINNLASLYWSMGRLDRSIPLFEDALRRSQKTLGDDHPSTLNTLANLGVNYKDAGRAAEAVPPLERAYAARGRYPRLNGVGPVLLEAYTKAGRQADAARLAGEQLAEDRKTAPPGSPQLGGLLASTGKTLLAIDPAAAEPVLRECVELREKLAPKSWSTANAKSMLGGALLGQRKYSEAEPLLLAGYAGLTAEAAAIQPQGKANLPDAADRLIRLYLETDRPAEAAKWRAERAKYPSEQAPPPRPAK